ncbi:MAG: SpoIIE family protein phosphatase [Treponema sp.]|nr:SpoIIE family protein phosphatase [Treponema sp.]
MSNETILIVEDEPLVGLELKEDLELLGYAVPEVIGTGEAVAEAIARHRPALVLMDVRLGGGLDGIEAAGLAKTEFDVPVIYLTAYSDAETLRRAALTAPDGFLLKPFDERELAANVQIALARARGGQSQRRERRFLERSAAEANSALIKLLPAPDAAGPGYLVGGFLEPCLSGSGDFFDVFPAGAGRRAFYGFDVMGHGMVATLAAFSLRELLPAIGRGKRGRSPSPAEVLRALYARYRRKGGAGPLDASFFTIAYGLLDEATGDYTLVRGGHMPVLQLGAGGELRSLHPAGAAVGVPGEVEVEESRGRLEPGDRLLLASDGLFAAFEGEDPFARSLERLSAFAGGLRGSSLEDFVGAFRRRVLEADAERGATDDSSLLVIERR